MTPEQFKKAALDHPAVQAIQAGSGESKESFANHIWEIVSHSWFGDMLKYCGHQLVEAIMPLIIALITRKLAGSAPAHSPE